MKFFKKCPLCGEKWDSLFLFLRDKTLHLNGYQADFEMPEKGLLFFTHKKENCRTTLAVEIENFLSLHRGIIYIESKKGQAECPGLCTDKKNLNRCEAKCKLAYVRDIIHGMKSLQTEKKAI